MATKPYPPDVDADPILDPRVFSRTGICTNCGGFGEHFAGCSAEGGHAA